MTVTLGQRGAWWPLLGTCEVEKFGIPRSDGVQAWGTGHCVRVAACGKGWRELDQGLQVEGDWQFGEGVGDMAARLSVDYILPRVFFRGPAKSIARPLRRSRNAIAGMGEQKIVRIRGG